MKPQVLLLTHGGWGMSLVEGVKMIIGAVDFVQEIPLMPKMTLQEYKKTVEKTVEKIPENSLILTDVFGGTTSNVAAQIGKDRKVKVISGLNMPLLLEACSQISCSETLDFKSILSAGRESIVDVVEKVLNSMKRKEGN